MSSPASTSRPRRLLGLVMAGALVLSACRETPVDAPAPASPPQTAATAPPPAPASTASTAATAPPATDAAGAALPAELCTADQGWSFLNAFVLADDATRRRYSEGDAAESFRIAMVDSRWSIREPAGSADDYSRVELQEIPSQDGFVVEYVRAKYAPNEDVESTYGEPGRYAFAIRDGCWKLLDQAR